MRFVASLMTVGISLLAALALTLGAHAGVASAASGSPVAPNWGSWQPYSSLVLDETTGTATGSATLPLAITCPSYGHCIAAGVGESLSGLEPDVMVESGPGEWAQPSVAPLPADAASGLVAAPVLTSVACPSSSSCVAVGAYTTSAGTQESFAVPFTPSASSVSFGTPEAITLPNDAATDSTQLGFATGVSCGSGGCTAVGTYVTSGGKWVAFTATQSASGTWAAAPVAAPAGVSDDGILNAISCPSTGACEAVGNYADGSGDQQAWAVQISGGAAGSAQAVVTVSDAMTAQTDAAPSLTSLRAFRVGLNSVSCPSAGVCTAAGGLGASASNPLEAITVPITAGVPGQFSAMAATTPGANAYLQGIWCADAGDCSAVGLEISSDVSAKTITSTPIVADQTGGTWSPPVTLQGAVPPSGSSYIIANADAIGCTSDGVCVSGAFLGSQSATSITESSYFAYSAPAPTIITTSLPAATVGQPYTATLQSSSGSGTGISWSLSQGSLPAGLTLDAATGVISGTPTAHGLDSFVVTAADAGPPSTSTTQDLSITVSSPVSAFKITATRVSGDVVTAILACSGAPCSGKFKLTGVEHLRGKTPIAVDARVRKRLTKRTVTLASGRYAVNAGTTKAIKVKLNHLAVRLLHKLGSLSAKLTLAPSGLNATTVTRTLKFKERHRAAKPSRAG